MGLHQGIPPEPRSTAAPRLKACPEESWIMRSHMLWLGLTVLIWWSPLMAQDRTELIAQGRKFFFDQECYGCHMVGNMGTPIGPDLSQVGSKYPPSYLVEWLRDPATQKPKSLMPKINLSDNEIRALASYLSSLR